MNRRILSFLPPFNERGYSLIEAMIAFALMGFLALGISRFFQTRTVEQKNLMLNEAKLRVIKMMEQEINNPVNIKSSLEPNNGNFGPVNRDFLDCLFNPSSCNRRYWNGINPQRINFSLSDGRGGYVPLSSFWSKEGAPACLPPRPDECPMIVDVSFWLTCAARRNPGPGGGSCPEFSDVNLLFQIRPTAPDADSNVGVNFNYPTPTGIIPNPQSYATVIPVKEIMKLYSQNCGTYHYVSGFRGDGRPICSCLNHRPLKDGRGQIRLDPAGNPYCESNACRPGDILLGFDVGADDAWQPVCLGPRDKYHCYNINLKWTPECADNYWITHIEYGQCDVIDDGVQKKKYYTTDNVTCADDSATCCRVYE
jgi:type II secretory pathway pseudopilin PulG